MLENTQVPNSIINPNSTAFKDDVTPYPYLTFATFFDQYTSTNITILYNEYILLWEKTKDYNAPSETYVANLKSRYIDLLNSINLEYLNEDEERFLTNLQLQNENGEIDKTGVDLLIPFYTDKINEITNYFIRKREDLKFTIQKNVNSNSKQGISVQLKNFIIDELLNNSIYEHLSDYTKDTIQSNLEIGLTEKYDTFSHYYDTDPDTTAEQYDVKSELFKKYFTNNILDYNKIAFANENDYLIQAIKEYPVFIKTFGFSFSTVNTSSDISNFKPKDFIKQEVSSNANDLNIQTYKKLSQKYAGADMYYVSANNTSAIIDKLFTTESITNNILNKKYTSIVNVPSDNLTTERLAGKFFISTNQGISFYNTFNKEYNKKENIEHGVYYFPDPEICGNIYGTSLTQLKQYPYTWKTNLEGLFYEKAYQNISGQLNYNYQSFYGYSTDIHECNLANNFESIVNNGVIYNYKVDTFGNEYALYKQKPTTAPDETSKFIDEISNIEPPKQLTDNELLSAGWFFALDGGLFVPEVNSEYYENEITSDYKEWPDYENGNYFYDILIDAGTVGIDLIARHSDYEKYAGFPVRPYTKELSTITTEDGELSTITVPSTVYAPGILDEATTTDILSNCSIYDGNKFTLSGNLWDTDAKGDGFNTTIYKHNPYISQRLTSVNTSTAIIDARSDMPSSIYDKMNQTGSAYIKYNNSSELYSLSSVLNFININTGETTEHMNITDIQNVDVIQDVLIITHKDGLIFNKIYIDGNGKLAKSSTPIKLFTNASTSFNNGIIVDGKNEQTHEETIYSKYYYIEKTNSVLFVKLTKVLNLCVDDNTARQSYDIIYPTIYMLYLDDLHINTLYSPGEFSILDFIIDSGEQSIEGQSKLLKNALYIEKPTITYNSLNNLFSMTYIIHDLLNYPHVVNNTFTCQMYTAYIISNDVYTPSPNIYVHSNTDIDALAANINIPEPIKIEKNGNTIISETKQELTWYCNDQEITYKLGDEITNPGIYYCSYIDSSTNYKIQICSNALTFDSIS